jgi:hypothetical protein
MQDLLELKGLNKQTLVGTGDAGLLQQFSILFNF